MNVSRPVRIVLVLTIAFTVFANVIWANTDSTLTISTPETKRSTKGKSGVRVGMIAGGIAGASLFLLAGLASEGLCDYECSDITALGYVGLGTVGLVTGGLTGALIGGIFGSMIPEHGKRTLDQTAQHHPLHSIASVSIVPGIATLTQRPENESGFMLRATLLAQLKPWFAIGPEITYANLAGGTFAVGGALYLGPREPGLRPYVVTALSAQHWETGIVEPDLEVVEIGLGGGLSWTPGSPNTHLGLEARYEFSPQNVDRNEGFTFVSTSAVLRRSW